MKIKQTIKTLVIGALLLVASFAIAAPTNTFALEKCGGVDTSIIKCDQTGGKDAAVEQTGVWGLLLLTINILTAGVGIAAIGGIIYGAILYTSAGGSPEQVKKAMGIITNVVIGIVAYALMYGVLNFLIPGGVFN
ncbi:hypothetical protein H7100_01965 [Candidatus Saccharibacteria bacterium]|nr:hypothetical protein [Candidatus Saccharibacteria bacterium]